MKQTNLTREHSDAVTRGLVAATAARSYSWIEELGNDTGATIFEGQVVVVLLDGTIALAATVNEPRPTGVALDDIDTGESGQVCFGGPVDLVSVVASVTAGNYGQTSTTAGSAQVTTGPATAFCMFTSAGTTPSAFLWGGRGGGGAIAGGGTGVFVQVNNGGEEMVASLGNLGATETIDISTGNWQRGTLNANCTLTFTGAVNGFGCSFTLFLTEDGTGGWTPSWPGSVVWIGGTTPTHDTTAGSVSIYIFLSYDGGTTWFGALAGGSGSSSALIWVPLTVYDPTTTIWQILVDGSGNAIMTQA